MDDDRHLGRSLVVEDGDLVLDAAASATRVREVSGRGNLLQALQLRVLTPLGSDRFNTLYGLDYAQIFGSEEGLRMTKELIKLNLVRTLATDARIHDVNEIRFFDDPDYLADHGVTAEELRQQRQSRRWEVEAVLETATAGEVAVRLGIGG